MGGFGGHYASEISQIQKDKYLILSYMRSKGLEAQNRVVIVRSWGRRNVKVSLIKRCNISVI